jgi:hypothetical protein
MRPFPHKGADARPTCVRLMATLSEWLRKKGFWVAGGQATHAPLTHVFLNGGKACVPSEARDDFLDAYAGIVASGRTNTLFAVERSGNTYRMFADFDVPLPSLSVMEGDALIRHILDIAMDNLPDVLRVGHVTVCLRPAHGGKVGAHLVWSDDLRVDDDQAAQARDEWVRACVLHSQGQRASVELDWDKIIDAAVYKKNGLRMPWSSKRGGDARSCYEPYCMYNAEGSKGSDGLVGCDLAGGDGLVGCDLAGGDGLVGCDLAGGDGLVGCDLAGGDGFVGCGKPVVVECFADGGCATDISHVRRWLDRTTLAGNFEAMAKVAPKAKAKPIRREPGSKDSKRGADPKRKANTDHTLDADEEAALRAALAAHCGPTAHYDGVAFTSIRVGDGSAAISSDSKFCLSAGREHTSNHVYFVVKPDGALHQCCYSAGCKGAFNRIGKGHPMLQLAKRIGIKAVKKKRKVLTEAQLLPVTAASVAERWRMARCAEVSCAKSQSQ